MSTTPLSIVIPCLNEQTALPILLDGLAKQNGIELEIIVCDGGSNDKTLEIAKSFNCRCFSTERGRANQMNFGAKKSSHNLLFFCHADTQINDNKLLSNAVKYLEQCRKENKSSANNFAGHFSLEFLPSKQARKAAYTFYERKTELNRPNTTNGDQGFMLSKSFFEELGCFQTDFPYFEDQRLAEKIRIQGTWVTLPGKLYTSARRFEKEGLDRRMILSMLAMTADTISFKAFFEQVPKFYAEQKETEKIEIIPILRLLNRLSFEAGIVQSLKNWYFIGRYARVNMWQVFFLFDVYLKKDYFLKFHNKVIAKIWANPLGDAIAGIITFIWMSILRLIYEYKWWKKGKKPSLKKVLIP